jgi:hypothetical protein
MHGQFPWHLVERIGVSAASVHLRVRAVLGGAVRPVAEIKRDWYY